MNERYTRVFSLPENLYATGAPVVISAGALLKDNQTGKVLAQLKLTNIQYKKIKAVKVKLFPQDTMGQPLGEAIDYQYLDLQLIRDGDFGSKTPIPFPDATTRAFAVEVTAVIFTDNTAWNADGSPWEPIPGSSPLHRQFENLIIEQLRLEQSGTCQFVVQEHKDLWLCTCGAVNHDGEARCHDCGKQLSQLHPLDVEGLTERANARLAEEARLAAEEKAAREAAAEATKKKTAKILKIVVPIICAVIAFVILLHSVIIPNNQYSEAVSLMEEERYKEAIAAFEMLEGYKDSVQKIEACKLAIPEKQYTNAVALMETDVVQAYEALIALNGYKDSNEKASSLYEKYVKIQLKNTAIGDYVTWGSYEQDNNTSNGKEDVEWLVLAKEEDKMLVISRYALDCLLYNSSCTDVTWENSSIREWLNTTFISSAFSSEEQAIIATTEVSADDNPSFGTDSGNDTQDKIFLLSIAEANIYFSSNEARRCRPTGFVQAKGPGMRNGFTWWWLRSPGQSQRYCSYVYYDGQSFDRGTDVNDFGGVIRPAFWINLDS